MSGNKYKVFDGGLSTELIQTFKHHEIVKDPLWSARLIATQPQDIILAHEGFLKAGSDIIETCTYQASLEGFQKHLGSSPSEAVELLKQGVNLCMKARDDFWLNPNVKLQKEKPLVAGSIGPYGAFLADRSEYTGKYVDHMSNEQLKDWHRPLIRHIWSCGVDLLAFETLPAKKEALAILELLREFPDSKAWISFSCKDEEHNNNGENMENVVEELLSKHGGNKNLVGIGINCSSPNLMNGAIRKIKSVLEKRGKYEDIQIICYPNGGGIWQPDGSWKRSHKRGDHVSEWMGSGAHWIGGCCNTSSEDISHIRKSVDKYLKMNVTK